MSNPTLINGFEDIVTFIKQQEHRNQKLKEEMEELKEVLAQKFYKHYDQMNYDKMYIAKTVGPDLSRMVDHLIEENQELNDKVQEGVSVCAWDTAQRSMKEMFEEINELKEENNELKEKNKFLLNSKNELYEELEKTVQEKEELKAEINHKNNKFSE